MKVVLSIKPEFANKIFDGTKKFEFRKSIFKNENIKLISGPMKFKNVHFKFITESFF
jgi:hypothetical protein